MKNNKAKSEEFSMLKLGDTGIKDAIKLLARYVCISSGYLIQVCLFLGLSKVMVKL
jgi:hypothetical protein